MKVASGYVRRLQKQLFSFITDEESHQEPAILPRPGKKHHLRRRPLTRYQFRLRLRRSLDSGRFKFETDTFSESEGLQARRFESREECSVGDGGREEEGQEERGGVAVREGTVNHCESN